jgi:hypothetical protein
MVNYGPHTDFLEKTFLAGNFVAGAGYGASYISLDRSIISYNSIA